MSASTNLNASGMNKSSLIGAGLARLADRRRGVPTLLCLIVVALAAFSGPIDIAEGVSPDPEWRLARTPFKVFKLSVAMAAGAIGLWGVVCLPGVRSVMRSMPGLALTAMAVLFTATSITSVTTDSLPIAIVFAGYVLFVATCLVVCGLRGTLFGVLVGVALFTFAALFLYVFVPRYGVFPEDFGGGTIVERLSGMSQPNHTGRSAMLGFLLVLYFLREPRSPRLLCIMLLGVFLTAGILASSRTALVAAVICVGILTLDLIFTHVGLIAVSLALVSAAGAVLALGAAGYEDRLVGKIVGLVTKTDNIEEVKSVTGRMEIWERSIELIQQRPLHGYGLGAAKVVLVDHLQSTHNILLHPTLAAGLGAGLVTLGLLGWNLVNVLIHPQLVIRALSAYILISGLMEDTIYEPFPGVCSVLWLACCLWPAMTVGVASPLKHNSP